MILKIDLDGVLYPFVMKFRLFCEMKLSRPLPPPVHYSMWEDWGMSSTEFYDLLDEFVLERHFQTGVLPDGADQALRVLYRKYDIHIVTARSAVLQVGKVKTYWQIDTAIWLHENVIPHKGLHFTKQKALIPGILIDDHVGNLKEASVYGQRAICFDQPWNQEWQGERATSWLEIADKLSKEQP